MSSSCKRGITYCYTQVAFLLFPIILLLFSATKLSAQTAPSITSFSPISAKPGDAVTITGTNFSTTASSNVVFFGATVGTVTTATTTSLTVTVPIGATYAPITVLNLDNNLLANSNSNFNPVFTPNKSSITTSDFLAKVDFTTGTGTNPKAVAIGDIDGDGKPDLVTANNGSNKVSVFLNTSTSGTISSGSFAAKVDFTTGSGSNPLAIAIGDLNGDGKPDLAVTCNSSPNDLVSVFLNTSSTGAISFNNRVDFTTGNNPSAVAIGDMDGDGKPELVVANSSSNSVSVLRNTSTFGSIAFANKVDFTTGTGSSPQALAIGDLDGDNKPDIAVVNNGNNSVSVFRNTATSGTIASGSFAARVNFTTGTSPQAIALGDLDGDGKLDLAVANNFSRTVSVFR
ncbi:MAG: FG-GAP-like repeat-containing protein, partial [Chitinophagaceae bacterium]|nr:FG-GAP-like repeat-containing protein [Chitinophagaceae bacterium]